MPGGGWREWRAAGLENAHRRPAANKVRSTGQYNPLYELRQIACSRSEGRKARARRGAAALRFQVSGRRDKHEPRSSAAPEWPAGRAEYFIVKAACRCVRLAYERKRGVFVFSCRGRELPLYWPRWRAGEQPAIVLCRLTAQRRGLAGAASNRAGR